MFGALLFSFSIVCAHTHKLTMEMRMWLGWHGMCEQWKRSQHTWVLSFIQYLWRTWVSQASLLATMNYTYAREWMCVHIYFSLSWRNIRTALYSFINERVVFVCVLKMKNPNSPDEMRALFQHPTKWSHMKIPNRSQAWSCNCAVFFALTLQILMT